MRVKELIDKLQKLDQEAVVLVTLAEYSSPVEAEFVYDMGPNFHPYVLTEGDSTFQAFGKHDVYDKDSYRQTSDRCVWITDEPGWVLK